MSDMPNSTGRSSTLPASTFARSSRSLTRSVRLCAGPGDVADLPLLLGGQLAVGAVEQQSRQCEDRVERRTELVAHVRQEARLEFAGLAQRLGPFVQLGVKRDDAAVRVFELSVELGELLLAGLDLVQASDQFAVLLAQRCERVGAPGLLKQGLRRFRDLDRAKPGSAFGQRLGKRDARARRPRIDVEAVDETPGARQSDSHSAARGMAALEDSVEIGDTGTRVADRNHEHLRIGVGIEGEFRATAGGVFKGVSRQFGHRGRDTSLVLRVEPEQLCGAARALTDRDDVVVAHDLGRKQRRVSCVAGPCDEHRRVVAPT
jgi:hypothetical protein